MRRGWPLVIAASCLLGLGAASATSLGAFNAPVAEGMGATVEACEVTGVSLVDGVLGTIPLNTPGAYDIDEVDLTGLSVGCDGMFPTVVVVGEDPVFGAGAVLAVQEFTGTSLPSSGDVTLTVAAGDPLGLLVLDLSTFVTEVRVVFCDPGTACQ